MVLVETVAERQRSFTTISGRPIARLYTATDLVRMLADVGFGEIECFGNYEGAELTRETRLVIRARKASA